MSGYCYEVRRHDGAWVRDRPIPQLSALLDTGYFAITLDGTTMWRRAPVCPTCGQVKP